MPQTIGEAGAQTVFVIEDEAHAEPAGSFPSRGEAMAELHRLAGIPWDQAPNLPPCTGWRGCGRRYELIEYDTTEKPRRELARDLILEMSAGGVRWREPEGPSGDPISAG